MASEIKPDTRFICYCYPNSAKEMKKILVDNHIYGVSIFEDVENNARDVRNRHLPMSIILFYTGVSWYDVSLLLLNHITPRYESDVQFLKPLSDERYDEIRNNDTFLMQLIGEADEAKNPHYCQILRDKKQFY